jgi:hypothetical protein
MKLSDFEKRIINSALTEYGKLKDPMIAELCADLNVKLTAEVKRTKKATTSKVQSKS